MDQNESSALALALKEERVTSLADVMSLSDDDIEMLRYTGKDKDGKVLEPKEVPLWARHLLRILQSYIHYQASENVSDYYALTKADYDDYRSIVYNANDPHVPPPKTFGSHHTMENT